MGEGLWSQLGQPGTVKLVAAADLEQALDGLAEEAEAHEAVLASKRWQRIPPQTALLEDCLRLVARLALSLWPCWYGEKFELGETFDEQQRNHLHGQALLRKLGSSLSLPWLDKAMALCYRQRLPVVPQVELAVQVQQLAKAIASDLLTLALAVEDPQPPQMALKGVAQASIWLAHHAQARVVLLVPLALARHPELAAVSYGALELGVPQPDGVEVEAVDLSVEVVVGSKPKGMPHPLSPSEERLAKRLETDPELKPLLNFNQTVNTPNGQSYRVDLLWPEGKLVVEIDGQEHGRPNNYYRDRLRDYELLIAGYQVLRLPQQLVMNDCERAVEMIRQVVQLRKAGRC